MRLVLILALAIATIPANPLRANDLPEPAIPGLRFYYPPEKVEPRLIEADVCVYGGTSGGVVAAVQSARMGKKTVLLEFGKHLGGLTTGGLSHTDGGDEAVCGGMAREYYKMIGQRNFRPSEAEAAYEKLLKDAGVTVHRLCHLDKVQKQGTRIVSITMENGLEVRAKQFLDATYEGDLLARAGVSWHAGREANSVYGETYNGIRQPGTGGHAWPKPVDPYKVQGDPKSGLLPRITQDPGVPGEGDQTIQAFCFRMRLTKDNPLPFPKPKVYDEAEYELLARLFETGAEPFIQFSIDTNNHHLYRGAYFIDYVGGNYDWPNADWLLRERIYQAHANYQIGVMWFLTHSDRIPEPYRSELRKWGLPRDEYQDTGGWTHQLYIREGRRMVGDYVMTQKNCQGVEVPKDSIGLASYNMDSHHCQMTVLDGAVANEGNVEIPVEPYPISYRALTPKRKECTNLLVPVALSSTHIAFGSIRMEPVFMLLGQSAATAASIAIDDNASVQDVNYEKLRMRLLADGQILEYTGPPRHRGRQAGIDPKTLEGVVIDNDKAELFGPWSVNNVTHPRVGETYLHDGNEAKGKCRARYAFKLEKAGRYEVRLSWPPNSNRATNVPVMIHGIEGQTKTVTVNQKSERKAGEAFTSLGEFELGKDGAIEISNEGTNGYVIADAVQILPAQKQACLDTCADSASADERPNLIFILCDDLAQGDVGCYGQKLIQTPNLDRMAREGTRFTQLYCGTTVCAPSRTSLMTGLHSGHSPVRANWETAPGEGQLPLPKDTVTVARILKEAGYATACTGKWGMGMFDTTGSPLKKGFDHFFGYNCQRHAHSYFPTYLYRDAERFELPGNDGKNVGQTYAQELIQKDAETWIRSHHKQPFFLFYAITLPHGRHEIDKLGQYAATDWTQQQKAYAAQVSRLDSDVGRILALLKELELDEKTLVMVSGDNGSSFDETSELGRRFDQSMGGKLRGFKRSLYEGGLRQAAIARWPGVVPAGRVCEDPWAFWDFLPTAAELAGAKFPEGFEPDGFSLLDMLKGGPAPKRDYFYWELHEGPFLQAVRFGDWKAVKNGPKKPMELYNLKTDEGEKQDVAEKHPELVAKALELLKSARRDDSNWPIFENQRQRAQWRRTRTASR